MKRILRALKSVYDFFAGDAILLAGTAIAFAAAFLLSHLATNALAAIAFVLLIVAALVTTLLREAGGSSR